MCEDLSEPSSWVILASLLRETFFWWWGLWKESKRKVSNSATETRELSGRIVLLPWYLNVNGASGRLWEGCADPNQFQWFVQWNSPVSVWLPLSLGFKSSLKSYWNPPAYVVHEADPSVLCASSHVNWNLGTSHSLSGPNFQVGSSRSQHLTSWFWCFVLSRERTPWILIKLHSL